MKIEQPKKSPKALEVRARSRIRTHIKGGPVEQGVKKRTAGG